MDWYQTWLYREVINAVWMLRTIVFLILIGNLVSPVLIWYLMSSRRLFSLGRSSSDKG